MFPLTNLNEVTIVLVEDHPDTRSFLTDFLTHRGARVIATGSAEDALQAIQQHHPDVVLSDIGLPGRSGFDLLKDIHALGPEHRKVPVIAMTALGGIVQRERAAAAGFQGLLRKPFDPDGLLKALQSVLR
ncbi:MAG TPA: response regulator [Chthoniobacterales bacterium]|jgi:CheY-like chemotaxis protein|nr:response regulator [Chthoniobacterales bacterium]